MEAGFQQEGDWRVLAYLIMGFAALAFMIPLTIGIIRLLNQTWFDGEKGSLPPQLEGQGKSGVTSPPSSQGIIRCSVEGRPGNRGSREDAT
jgi:hypothetical protein